MLSNLLDQLRIDRRRRCQAVDCWRMALQQRQRLAQLESSPVGKSLIRGLRNFEKVQNASLPASDAGSGPIVKTVTQQLLRPFYAFASFTAIF